MGDFDEFDFDVSTETEEFDPQEVLESFSNDELLAELTRRGVAPSAITATGLGASKQLTVTLKGDDITVRLPAIPVADLGLSLEAYQEAIYRRAFERGDSRCAVCSSRAKIECRRITGSMAATMAWLCREYQDNGGKWVHLDEMSKRFSFALKNKEWSILERWVVDGVPLLQRPDGENTKTTSKGFWKPSTAAYDLVEGRISVPRYVYSYKNRVLGYSSAVDGITDIVNNQFDLALVLEGNFNASNFQFTKVRPIK